MLYFLLLPFITITFRELSQMPLATDVDPHSTRHQGRKHQLGAWIAGMFEQHLQKQVVPCSGWWQACTDITT